MKDSALNKLAKKINKEFDINIFANTRKREVVDGRSVFCYIAKHTYGMSLHSIAEYFKRNGKPYDHSTAVHAIKMFETVVKFNPRARNILNEVLKDTDQNAHAKFLVDEILVKADPRTKSRVIKVLNIAYTNSLEQQKAPV